MRQKIIIAIDGFSSCGKSTLAKHLACKLQYIYVDSGAMYRAITLYFLKNNVVVNNKAAVESALKNIHLHFMFDELLARSIMYLNGEDVEQQIRNMLISEKVSEVAAVKQVRTFAVQQQQNFGKNKGIVMDGRDIGTTVFPNAELKVFMTADISIRVQRRFKELHVTDKNITIEEVKNNLEMRDYIDTNREVSPLRKAKDTIVLDNSSLTEAQQLMIALQWSNEKINSLQ